MVRMLQCQFSSWGLLVLPGLERLPSWSVVDLWDVYRYPARRCQPFFRVSQVFRLRRIWIYVANLNTTASPDSHRDCGCER